MIAYLIILAAAILYAVGALFLKRATGSGIGVTRILFLINILRIPLFLPVLLLDNHILDLTRWWIPAVTSVILFLGLICVLLAIRMGDVSVQTPLMGTKVIMVAVFSVLMLGGPIPMSWWVGAVVTAVAIFILGVPGLKGSDTSKVSKRAIVLAMASCAFFALTDVITTREAPLFGEIPFLFILSIGVAAFSAILMPFFRKPLASTPPGAWKWGIIGSFFMALEETAYLWVLSIFGDPTLMCIIYSSRGIWSIGLVYFLGHKFGVEEADTSGAVMAWRLGGSLLLCLAIAIVLFC